ncbi:MAG: UDP-N-acetylmuramate dehydrogenase [Candidatus Pacebacteria bacterium]|nr:UDP-N-acetylmuramate dehydrogenase [Candidatus Paceibacterota bacterium]
MLSIQENILLADYTTFKIGGPARYFAVIKNEEDLKQAVIFARAYSKNSFRFYFSRFCPKAYKKFLEIFSYFSKFFNSLRTKSEKISSKAVSQIGSEKSLPIYVLGGGSNLLISDEGVDGLVLKMEIKGVTWMSESQVIVGAGEVWDDLVEKTVEKGLYGLENLSGIPGTVGASVIQNIEAYGAEVSRSVETVEVFNKETLEIENLTNEQCNFNYRQSIFKTEKGKKYIVLKVIFNLAKQGKLNLEYKDVKNYLKENNLREDQVDIKKAREILLFVRRNKLPDLEQIGTAGSFFKLPVVDSETLSYIKEISPDMPHYRIDIGCKTSIQGEHKIPLGHLLEQFGWKGYKDGNVGIFEKHSLIVVNHGYGKSKDIKNLVAKITKDVKEKTGIDIEPEVVMW